MKKLLRRTVALLSIFVLCMAMSMTAFADYDPDTDPRGDTGEYLLDNYTQRDSTVLLYVYADSNDRDVISQQHGIGFSYFGNITDISMFDAEKGTKQMSFLYRPANAEVYAALGDGEVWVYQFSIENGLYMFNGIDFLTKNLVFDENAPKSDKLRYVENETIHIYTMQGGWSSTATDWYTEENKTLFAEWAKENEAKLAERNAPQAIEETSTEVETVEEITTEEVTMEEMTTETVEEAPAVETKTTPVEVVEEPNNMTLYIIIGVGAVLIIAIVVMAIFLFRNNDEE